MRKLTILLLAAVSITACQFPLQQIDFDTDTFNRERAAWLEEDIAAYSYEFKYGSLAVGPGYIHARVTVEDNAITGIENLKPEKEWKVDTPPGFTDFQLSIIHSYGSVTGIYEHISNWYAAERKKLGDKQQLRCEMKYNAQYRYPEYVSYGVSTYQYAGNNTWVALIGQGRTTLELSDFQVVE